MTLKTAEVFVAEISRFKNRLISKVLARFPSLAKRSVAAYRPVESKEIPWTPVRKPLRDSKVAIVTTAGVHHRDQRPFDMRDQNGDPTFRVIDATKPLSDLMITHDYYDHADADRDINIVFPVERLREFEEEGVIDKPADRHYGFMGHVVGPHIETLVNRTAPETAERLSADGVDIVLLTPG